jgi:hypothetical protein
MWAAIPIVVKTMAFRTGEKVKIGKNDILRRGESARVKLILPQTVSQPFTEYLVEFDHLPKILRSCSERFLLCRYREEDLVKED